MTITQIIALLLAGPVAIQLTAKLLLTVTGQNKFNILEAFILMVMVAVLLVAFLGVQ